MSGVPTLVVARTDALGATLLTSDVDERDRPLRHRRSRTAEGFYEVRNGMDVAVARALAYAPHADLIWCETSTPDLDEARIFAEAVQGELSRQDARLQLLAVVQLEAPPRRRRRSPSSKASSARWATASSSSPSPVGTR